MKNFVLMEVPKFEYHHLNQAICQWPKSEEAIKVHSRVHIACPVDVEPYIPLYLQ